MSHRERQVRRKRRSYENDGKSRWVSVPIGGLPSRRGSLQTTKVTDAVAKSNSHSDSLVEIVDVRHLKTHQHVHSERR